MCRTHDRGKPTSVGQNTLDAAVECGSGVDVDLGHEGVAAGGRVVGRTRRFGVDEASMVFGNENRAQRFCQRRIAMAVREFTRTD